MRKLNIILADPEQSLIDKLTLAFLGDFGDKIALQEISDPDYLHQWLQKPQAADLLVIHEKWYDEGLARHPIAKVIVLTDGRDEVLSQDFMYANRYVGVKELYFILRGQLGDQQHIHTQFEPHTRLIMCYSPVGGVGTSTIAYELSKEIASFGRKILYVNTSHLQSHAPLLGVTETCSLDFCDRLKAKEKALAIDSECIKPHVHLSIFKPLSMPLSYLGLDFQHWHHLIATVKQTNQFDFIVVDVASEFSGEKMELMNDAEKVILLADLHHESLVHFKHFLRFIDYKIASRFYFLANKVSQHSTDLVEDLKQELKVDISILPDSLNTDVRQTTKTFKSALRDFSLKIQ